MDWQDWWCVAFLEYCKQHLLFEVRIILCTCFKIKIRARKHREDIEEEGGGGAEEGGRRGMREEQREEGLGKREDSDTWAVGWGEGGRERKKRQRERKREKESHLHMHLPQLKSACPFDGQVPLVPFL